MANLQQRLETLINQHILFSPNTGQIRLFDQRMLLMQGLALSELRSELLERLGQAQAKAMLTRLGYKRGLHYFEKVREIAGNDLDLAAALGMHLAELEGFVLNKPIEKMQIDVEKGIFNGDYYWNNSWEAEAHINQFGISRSPTCWMMEGFASGYSTAMFGRPVLWQEVECTAMGHAACRVIGKPLKDWEEAENIGGFLKIEDFVDLPKHRFQLPSSNALSGNDSALAELVGASAGFNTAIYLLKRVAPTTTSVILLGESGVGKERFARTLHAISERADKPWISVNCAAIPNDLVEAELFGVERGAFTGATTSRPGRFERANGGTLFLDEIGSLPLSAQGKLLRVLQENEVERVGDTQVRQIDVRIIAAANNDLRKAVEDGHFRADLFYRLNVYPIEIPSLRERRDDIPLLFSVFVERYAKKAKKAIPGVTRRALDALWHYEWPGNVRELENLVERASILVDPDEAIDLHHLFSGGEKISFQGMGISHTGKLAPFTPPKDRAGNPANMKIIRELLKQDDISLAQIEHNIIEQALESHDGNVSATAKFLKMGRGQLQYKLSQHTKLDR
ncbi:sigma 54-interacting transcriptional regulator [Zhongshania sp. BJYM1]|uniref:sigma 54-interacting transcriptional regulator n=1 Tax=Zhongshania aquatica TaxID=2965069 RepID=UPI0022B5752E|nr:sigma 54-interacting transcriptional regulator [Marortus sp. BJYM1]